MNSFLNPHNAVNLTGVIDLTAHNISSYDETVSKEPQNIKDIFTLKTDISTAEPFDVQIDELGDNIITMYQFIGDINDTKVGGLESLLNYMNENSFSKDNPAVNEHHYHTTRKQYNQHFTTHNICNVDKRKYYKTNNRNFSDNSFHTKKQLITNSLTNYITKGNSITNDEHVSNIKMTSTKHYTTNAFRSNDNYTGNKLYKKYDSIALNNTENTTKHINNYSNDVTNSYKINRITA